MKWKANKEEEKKKELAEKSKKPSFKVTHVELPAVAATSGMTQSTQVNILQYCCK